MNLIFGDTECRDWENSFGTMRLLRLVQTQINLRIRMRMDDITSTLTVLYDGNFVKLHQGTPVNVGLYMLVAYAITNLNR